MNCETEGDSGTLVEGSRYDARHLVWENAHQLGSPIYRLRRSLILSLLPEKSISMYFLDVGCGTGDYASLLLDRGHRVDAIDVSEAAIKQAVKRIPAKLQSHFHAVVGDFSRLGQETLYNGILCSEVLEHVQDDEGLLKRLHSLLLPKGILILSVPADPKLWSHDDVFSGHVRRYTQNELVAKLERAGFTVQCLWSYGFPLLRIYTWLKIKLLGRPINFMTRCKGGRTKWIISFVAAVLNVLVWLLDRRLLHTNRGIGFVVRCQKA